MASGEALDGVFGVWDEPAPGDASTDPPVEVLHATSTQSAEPPYT